MNMANGADNIAINLTHEYRCRCPPQPNIFCTSSRLVWHIKFHTKLSADNPPNACHDHTTIEKDAFRIFKYAAEQRTGATMVASYSLLNSPPAYLHTTQLHIILLHFIQFFFLLYLSGRTKCIHISLETKNKIFAKCERQKKIINSLSLLCCVRRCRRNWIYLCCTLYAAHTPAQMDSLERLSRHSS